MSPRALPALAAALLLAGCLGPAPLPGPSVAVEPAEPDSGDTLVLVVDEIPEGEGRPELAYRVAWERDGAPVAELAGADEVASDLTSPGETWTVAVTVLQGELEGEPVTASVTIAAGDDDDSGPDDDDVGPDDDDVGPDDDDAAPDPPVITAIEGWNLTAAALGTARAIAVEPGVVPEGVVVPDESSSNHADHRFADAWRISGERLDLITEVQLLNPGATCPDAPFTGLSFEPGGTDVQRILSIDLAGLCAGAFTLVLLTPAGNVEADVFVLQGEQGPQGEPGDDGTDGAPGADGLSCWDLDGNGVGDVGTEDVNADGLVDVLDCHADTSLCPTGYTDVTATESGFPGEALCERADGSGDQVVKVGDYWIDRYEISVWEDPLCSTTHVVGLGSVYPIGSAFPPTGNWTAPLYACSLGVEPSVNMTWFQAQQACQLSGKSMCTNAQWQAAAAGTDEATCNTGTVDCDGPNAWTGGNTQCGGCQSGWGAFDMVGNSHEWVAEWSQAGQTWITSSSSEVAGVWGPDYGDDTTWGVNGASYRSSAEPEVDGLPGSWMRGGRHDSAEGAGVFTLDTGRSPQRAWTDVTTRCCINR